MFTNTPHWYQNVTDGHENSIPPTKSRYNNEYGKHSNENMTFSFKNLIIPPPSFWSTLFCFIVCVEVLRPSQPNGVMSSLVSLPNHTFTGQAYSSKRLTSTETDNCPLNLDISIIANGLSFAPCYELSHQGLPSLQWYTFLSTGLKESKTFSLHDHGS